MNFNDMTTSALGRLVKQTHQLAREQLAAAAQEERDKSREEAEAQLAAAEQQENAKRAALDRTIELLDAFLAPEHLRGFDLYANAKSPERLSRQWSIMQQLCRLGRMGNSFAEQFVEAVDGKRDRNDPIEQLVDCGEITATLMLPELKAQQQTLQQETARARVERLTSDIRGSQLSGDAFGLRVFEPEETPQQGFLGYIETSN
jgi:hypothetical protein